MKGTKLEHKDYVLERKKVVCEKQPHRLCLFILDDQTVFAI